MIFELRRYPIKPGQREAWVKLMDERIIPFQQSRGMAILASFVDRAGDSYVWIRRFASAEERDALYTAVYESDYWREELSPPIGDLIDREGIEVTLLQATPRSLMQ